MQPKSKKAEDDEDAMEIIVKKKPKVPVTVVAAPKAAAPTAPSTSTPFFEKPGLKEAIKMAATSATDEADNSSSQKKATDDAADSSSSDEDESLKVITNAPIPVVYQQLPASTHKKKVSVPGAEAAAAVPEDTVPKPKKPKKPARPVCEWIDSAGGKKIPGEAVKQVLWYRQLKWPLETGKWITLCQGNFVRYNGHVYMIMGLAHEQKAKGAYVRVMEAVTFDKIVDTPEARSATEYNCPRLALTNVPMLISKSEIDLLEPIIVSTHNNQYENAIYSYTGDCWAEACSLAEAHELIDPNLLSGSLRNVHGSNSKVPAHTFRHVDPEKVEGGWETYALAHYFSRFAEKCLMRGDDGYKEQNKSHKRKTPLPPDGVIVPRSSHKRKKMEALSQQQQPLPPQPDLPTSLPPQPTVPVIDTPVDTSNLPSKPPESHHKKLPDIDVAEKPKVATTTSSSSSVPPEAYASLVSDMRNAIERIPMRAVVASGVSEWIRAIPNGATHADVLQMIGTIIQSLSLRSPKNT
jgi:hypothetical protein